MGLKVICLTCEELKFVPYARTHGECMSCYHKRLINMKRDFYKEKQQEQECEG